MATGIQTQYNYNNGSYSYTGYPFPRGQLKLQCSYSTAVYNEASKQSIVYVSVTLQHYGINWAYSAGREVSVYWNDTLVATFNPPTMNYTDVKSTITALGQASFIATHNSDGTCSGTLKVEWASTALNYTIDGITINVTELGCLTPITIDPISSTTTPTDTFTINGKSFLSVCQADGLEVTRASVNEKTITSITGTQWKKEKKRHVIKAKLLDMSSAQYAEYAGYFETNPASVTYKDDESGSVQTGTFYITNIQQTKRKVIQGVTFLTDISFELTEKTSK